MLSIIIYLLYKFYSVFIYLTLSLYYKKCKSPKNFIFWLSELIFTSLPSPIYSKNYRLIFFTKSFFESIFAVRSEATTADKFV